MSRLEGFVAAVLAAMAFAVLANAADDHEQRAEARRQFDTGTKAFSAKRFREAAVAFEAACAYRASGTALYTAGLAWEQAGEPDRAADDYTRALDTPDLGEKNSKEARSRLDDLVKNLGMVAVTGPSGTLVALDDHSDAPVPARLHGMAGRHVVVIRYTNDKVGHRNIVLKARETLQADVSPPSEPTASTSPPPAPPVVPTAEPPLRSSQAHIPVRKIVGIGFIGAAVAAAGAGTILGLEALDSRHAYAAHPNRESFDHASSMQTMTNVAWATAAVLTVGGVALVLWPKGKEASSSQTSVGVAPFAGGLTMRGAW